MANWMADGMILFMKATQLDLFDTPVDVEGYTRADGTFVPRHQAPEEAPGSPSNLSQTRRG